MNDCEEEGEGVVPFLTCVKYMLVFEYSHASTCRAQRTVIDVIVRGNWLSSSHKTAACCLASFVPKLALHVPHQVTLTRATSKT